MKNILYKTILGMIPKDWEVVPLKYVVEFSQYGLSLLTENDAKIPMFKMNNFSNGRMTPLGVDFVNLDKCEFDKYRIQKGDLLFNRTNSYDLVGKTSIFDLEGDYVFASYLVRFRLKAKIAAPEFINYFMNSPFGKRKMVGFVTKGVSQANINPTTFQEFYHIPLPPLREQKEIAELLRAWDEGIEKIEKLITAKQKLKKGLMQQILTGKKRFREFKGQKWKEYQIHEVVKTIFSNVDKVSHKDEMPVLLCNYMDVYKNQYITNELPFMEATAKKNEISKFSLMLGDVIITKDSETPDDIANSAVVIEPLKNVLCGYHLAILRLKPNVISGAFLTQMLMLQNIRHKFTRVANGATRYGLGIDDIRKIPLCIPDIKEQHKIASVLSVADQEIELLQKQLETMKQHKKGLMQKLLTGKIRVRA